MVLIDNMPLIQQVLTATALTAAIVLAVVARRRRAGAEVTATSADASPRRERTKKADKPLPRRKRRKLAAEAARGMGLAPEAVPAGTEISVPPVAAAPPPAPAPVPEPDVAVVAAAVPVVVAAAAPSDDPYVSHDVALEPAESAYSPAADEAATPGVVVADPGWPSPGELAASFDPDVFDPLPEVHDVTVEYGEDDGVADQPTGVIEMPDLDEALAASEALAETADRWEDDFDPAVGWADDEAGAPPAVEVGVDPVDEVMEDWDVDVEDVPADPPMAVAVSPVDMEQFWGDPDEDWADPADGAVGAEPAAVAQLAEVDAGEGIDPPEIEWPEDAAAWEPGTDADVPSAPVSPVDAGTATAGWPIAGGPTGPVVLDLAALAASGRPLELIIEPSGDGNGVRLRIGAPGAALASPDPGEAADAPVEAAAPETAPRDETPVTQVADEEPPAEDPVADVPFLTGGFAATAEEPGIGSPASASDPADVEETHHPPVAVVDGTHADDDPLDPFDPVEIAAIPADESDTEPDDDPARILADIRARLADLDARRHSRA